MKLMRVDNTRASVLKFGSTHFYFSYETCVGFNNLDLGFFKTEEKFSLTTSKHMKLMGMEDFTPVPKERFAAALDIIASALEV